MSKRILPLPPPELAVERVAPSADQLTVATTLRTAAAACSGCNQTSARIHASYQCRLINLPWCRTPDREGVAAILTA